jgi:methionyl-tRNA formyltransferase
MNGDFEVTLPRNEQDMINSFLKRAWIIKSRGINDRQTIKRIRNLGKSIIVCNSGVLKDKILSLPGTIFLNIHASKLPLYRGMNNIEWALFENNPVYVTVHRISRGIDEGDILYQQEIDIENKNLTLIQDYRHFCFSKSNEVLGKVIRKLFNNEISYIPQGKKDLPLMQYYSMHPILKKRLQEKLMASRLL